MKGNFGDEFTELLCMADLLYRIRRQVGSAMDNEFLLTSKWARRLYHECAQDLPIIDYHNHLSMADIAADREFENITRLWISPDPYKHRAMRILGIPERYITGDGSDYEKFAQWYCCLPRLAGNPLYHWSLMEMDKVFGITLSPFGTDPRPVWEQANEALRTMSARKILEKFNIEYCAPCTSLTDDLGLFGRYKGICPSLRGDDIIDVKAAFINRLEEAADMEIESLEAYREAARKRLLVFLEKGCRFSYHALDEGFRYFPDDGKNDERFLAARRGKPLEKVDRQHLSSYILKMMAELYAQYGLIMQLHMGAERKTSTRLYHLAGPAGGYAAIGSPMDVKMLTGMLDDMEQGKYGLPKILLFVLNPADNAAASVLSGSYSKDGVEALISQGPAWWWCDHYQGIKDMLNSFSAFSVMSVFAGMTTDSRSLLSFVRHDYFRRILCQWMGEKVQEGILPDDFGILSDTVKRMCYENARKMVKEDT